MIEYEIPIAAAAATATWRSLTPAEVAAIQVVADAMVDYVQAYWPVSDRAGPHSRDSWRGDVDPDSGSVWLRNPAPYAIFVHYAGDKTPIWETLLPRVASAYQALLEETATAAIATTTRRAGLLTVAAVASGGGLAVRRARAGVRP